MGFANTAQLSRTASVPDYWTITHNFVLGDPVALNHANPGYNANPPQLEGPAFLTFSIFSPAIKGDLYLSYVAPVDPSSFGPIFLIASGQLRPIGVGGDGWGFTFSLILPSAPWGLLFVPTEDTGSFGPTAISAQVIAATNN